jgi:transcriptional regulator with XRE-family HTH domain
MSTFELLVELRNYIRISQKEMSEYLKISKSTMNKYEKGTRKISSEMQDKYCEKLMVKLRVEWIGGVKLWETKIGVK